MLVEFRVKNFRNFRDEQVLSLVASKDKSLLDTNTSPTGLKAAPTLVRSAVVYGANGGGKSNLIEALRYMRGVVVESATTMRPDQTFSVQPFRLDATSVDQPTEFEVTFILDGVRYQYGFAMTQERITSEHLLVYKTSKAQHWFERHFDADSGKDAYSFGPGLKGPKTLWAGATRPNALFLSMAAQLNSKTLQPVLGWFTNNLVIFNKQAPLIPQTTIRMLQRDEDRLQIRAFLTAADLGITDIKVVTRKVPGPSAPLDLVAGQTDARGDEVEELCLSHAYEQGNAVSGLMNESNGTRKLVSLAGPMLDAFRKGRTLIIDDLNASLHPLLVRELVRLFHRPAAISGSAQLVFTTRDASLLDAPDLLRRDQVWFAEKGQDQSSTLISLHEFIPRKHEALGRGYLAGRYAGVPFLNP